MSMTTGMRVYGVSILDRETGKSHHMHDACADALSEMLREAGVDPMSRLVPMGPATSDADEPCEYVPCGKALGVES